jgi:hypothetical protein
MKYLKMLGLTALAAMAVMAFTAASASATTLEEGATATLKPVQIESTLKANTSAILKDTAGFSKNTCVTSEVKGASEEQKSSGAAVTGPITSLTFENCTRPVKVDAPGKLEVTHIKETTNGTISSEEAQVTVGSAIGTLNCETGATTHLGTLNAATQTIAINAVINCGIIPSAKWEAEYTITSPANLGVVA